MAIYEFNDKEQFVSINKIPDFRTDAEKQLTPLSSYNHEKADIAYAERLAEEIINVSGAWVTLFLKEPQRDTAEDDIWDEDADPLYRAGKHIKAFFKPEPTLTELTRWGVDTPLRITVVFSRAMLMMDPGIGSRLLLPGDVIEAPYNLPTGMVSSKAPTIDVGPLRFRVLNTKQEGFFEYRWLYVNATCELLTGDEALKVRTNNVDKNKH